MPRQARLRIPGLPVHLIQRGNNKLACFRDERDHRIYLSLLDELSDFYGCAVHAYALMTNHVHLLLTPRRTDGPSLLMKHLGQRFVQYVNRKHGRTGSLFEGRFRSCIVDTEGYLLRCHRYIEMNPVRAGMVAHPSQYRWSSYGTNAEGRPSELICPHPVYLALAADDERRRARYRSLFDEAANDEELRRIREAVNGGMVLGRAEFVDALGACFGAKVARGKPGRPAKPQSAGGTVPPKGKRGLSPV
jgi:putative transposase